MSSNEATEDILSNIDNEAYSERKYLMVSSQVDVGSDHYDILLLSEKSMIMELNQINLSILFITSLVSMLIASFFGVYVQNNIF